MRYDATSLVAHPGNSPDPDVIVRVTPELAGWEHIWFEVRRLAAGSTWSWATDGNELALVPLGGRVVVESERGRWQVGGRTNVFAGLPHALYLPRTTAFTIIAETDCEYALAWTPAHTDREPVLVQPDDVAVEIRGGDNATRQINGLLPPGFPCDKLVLVEVYTPGGNWSSYPPHKHDVHITNDDGSIREADLEEVYFYRFDKPDGYAFQRIYTDESSPLQQAGNPIDAVVLARENDAVLIPEGYHPVTSAPGYTAYYLNVLAGSAQSLANRDDPRYAWVKDSYHGQDTRIPIYSVE